MKIKLLQYGISIAVGAAIAIAIMSFKGVFSESDAVKIMQILSDSFFVPGVILAGVGLLVFASNGGLFDIFSYAAITFVDCLRRDVTKRRYRTYYDYKEARKDKPKRTGYLLISGLIFIAISAIFLIFYYQL